MTPTPPIQLTILLEIDQALDNVGVELGILVLPLSAGPLPQPGRFLHLPRRRTAIRIGNEQRADEVPCLLTNIFPYFLRLELKFATEDVLSDLHQGFRTTASTERRVARKQQKRNNTNSPYVASLVVASTDHLRGDSIWRPDRLVLDLTELEMLGQTKVDHLELRVG